MSGDPDILISVADQTSYLRMVLFADHNNIVPLLGEKRDKVLRLFYERAGSVNDTEALSPGFLKLFVLNAVRPDYYSAA